MTVSQNYDNFIEAVEKVKSLLPSKNIIKNQDILELIKIFAKTWISLEAYDKDKFPKKGITKKQIKFTAKDLSEALLDFKQELIKNKQATEIFGQEKNKNSIEGIIGNIFQSFNEQDVYPTIEQKAAHLLYFIIKNHSFTDGNKRSGAFAFIWFLQKAQILTTKITPETLTALTLLVAESNPKDKEKMIGLVLLILKQDK